MCRVSLKNGATAGYKEILSKPCLLWPSATGYQEWLRSAHNVQLLQLISSLCLEICVISWMTRCALVSFLVLGPITDEGVGLGSHTQNSGPRDQRASRQIHWPAGKWIAHRLSYRSPDAVNVPLGACDVSFAAASLIKLMSIQARGCDSSSLVNFDVFRDTWTHLIFFWLHTFLCFKFKIIFFLSFFLECYSNHTSEGLHCISMCHYNIYNNVINTTNILHLWLSVNHHEPLTSKLLLEPTWPLGLLKQ